jgi:hypothetical protein
MNALIFRDFRKHDIDNLAFAKEFADREGDYCVYVIREREEVFYVGQVATSSAPFSSGLAKVHRRIMGHFHDGDDPKKAERIGCLLQACLPESDSWTIEMLTQPDCERATGRQFWPGKTLVTDLEEAMIAVYRPCLNVRANAIPARIPSRYRNRYSKAWASLHGGNLDGAG